MMVILTLVLFLVFTALLTGAYAYMENCARLRKRLLTLGVSAETVRAFPVCVNAGRLKALVYEKETELAEECFLTVDR